MAFSSFSRIFSDLIRLYLAKGRIDLHIVKKKPGTISNSPPEMRLLQL